MLNSYKDRIQEVDELKKEIGQYRPFSKDLVNNLQEY